MSKRQTATVLAALLATATLAYFYAFRPNTPASPPDLSQGTPPAATSDVHLKWPAGPLDDQKMQMAFRENAMLLAGASINENQGRQLMSELESCALKTVPKEDLMRILCTALALKITRKFPAMISLFEEKIVGALPKDITAKARDLAAQVP